MTTKTASTVKQTVKKRAIGDGVAGPGRKRHGFSARIARARTRDAAAAAEIHANMKAANALRQAQGRPSLEEEEAEDKAFFRELIAEGFPLRAGRHRLGAGRLS